MSENEVVELSIHVPTVTLTTETSEEYPMSARSYVPLMPPCKEDLANAAKIRDRLEIGRVMAPIGARVNVGHVVESENDLTTYTMDDIVPVPLDVNDGFEGSVLLHNQIPLMIEEKPPEVTTSAGFDFGRLPSPSDVLLNTEIIPKAKEMVLAITAREYFNEVLQRNVENQANSATSPFLFNLAFVRRDWCETDQRFLQLLPYIVFYKIIDGEYRIFVYQRGKGVGEGRLALGCSIGVGGHINPRDFLSVKASYTELGDNPSFLVDKKRVLAEGFWDGILTNVIRELSEEVSFNEDELAIEDIFKHNMEKDKSDMMSLPEYLHSKTVFWSDNTATDVERTHLGMFMAFEVPADCDITIRDDQLIDVGFKPLEELWLDLDEQKLPTRLEFWSRAIVDSLYFTLATSKAVGIEGYASSMFHRAAMTNNENIITAEQLSKIAHEHRWSAGTIAQIFNRKLKYYAMNAFIKA